MCDLSDPISEAKQNVFIENVKRYNVMVDDLTKCLLKQTDLFTSIQHEFKHIKDSLTTRDTAHNSYVRLKKSIKLLRNYCEQFSNEQMNIITDIADRQTLITWQNRKYYSREIANIGEIRTHQTGGTKIKGAGRTPASTDGRIGERNSIT
ncbi:hypothetical protein DMN91_005840 [Ooceraea biroi]|uniref:Uncharacterized protein n=1 Tax=Ooceraea biroi TaxID=2015173 RepID=A0A3L8DM41_OOCBI|nr:hypothetical protein DMN91_005840 [Ooceraea biroi]